MMLNLCVKFLFVFLMSLFFHTTESMEHREAAGINSIFSKCFDVLKVNIADTGPCKAAELQLIMQQLPVDNFLEFMQLSVQSDCQIMRRHAYRRLAFLATHISRDAAIGALAGLNQHSLHSMVKEDLACMLKKFRVNNLSSIFGGVAQVSWSSNSKELVSILLENGKLIRCIAKGDGFLKKLETVSPASLPQFKASAFDSEGKAAALFSFNEQINEQISDLKNNFSQNIRKLYTLPLEDGCVKGEVFDVNFDSVQTAAVDEYCNVYLVEGGKNRLDVLCKRYFSDYSGYLLSTCQLAQEMDECVAICPTPRANSVAVVARRGVELVDIRNVFSLKQFFFEENSLDSQNACRSRNLLDGGSSLFINNASAVLLWDLRNPKTPVRNIEFPPNFEPLSMALSPCARTVAVGGRDGTICLYDVELGELVHRYVSKTKSFPVSKLTFGPSVERLLAAGGTGIKFLSARCPNEPETAVEFIDMRQKAIRRAKREKENSSSK